jgi:hypothetical protein
MDAMPMASLVRLQPLGHLSCCLRHKGARMSFHEKPETI